MTEALAPLHAVETWLGPACPSCSDEWDDGTSTCQNFWHEAIRGMRRITEVIEAAAAYSGYVINDRNPDDPNLCHWGRLQDALDAAGVTDEDHGPDNCELCKELAEDTYE